MSTGNYGFVVRMSEVRNLEAAIGALLGKAFRVPQAFFEHVEAARRMQEVRRGRDQFLYASPFWHDCNRAMQEAFERMTDRYKALCSAVEEPHGVKSVFGEADPRPCIVIRFGRGAMLGFWAGEIDPNTIAGHIVGLSDKRAKKVEQHIRLVRYNSGVALPPPTE